MTNAAALGVDAWLDAALVALVEGGPQAVAVEPLARALGVTKGSFYWHFTNRDALFHALVDRWSARTDELIAEVSHIEDPRLRLATLIAAAHRSNDAVRTMRAMSNVATIPKVGARVKAVARRRHTFIAGCFRALGLSKLRSESAARVVHAAYLGTGVLEALGVGATTETERRAYFDAFVGFALASSNA